MNWYPFRDIGGVKNANLDAAVNLDVNERHGQGRLLHDLGPSGGERCCSRPATRCCSRRQSPSIPASRIVKQVARARRHRRARSARLDLRRRQGTGLLLADPPEAEADARRRSTPPPRRRTSRPIEELYLDRPAHRAVPRSRRWTPSPYWEEALRRDPGDIRVNTALGINYFKKARFAEAEKFLRKAHRAAHRQLHVAQGRRGDLLSGPRAEGAGQDRRGLRARSTRPPGAWPGKAAGYYSLAEIATARGDMTAALRFRRPLDRRQRAQHPRAESEGRRAAPPGASQGSALQVLAHGSRTVPIRWTCARWRNAGWRRKTPADAKIAGRHHERASGHRLGDGRRVSERRPLAGRHRRALRRRSPRRPTRSAIHAMVYYYLGYFAAEVGPGAEGRRVLPAGRSRCRPTMSSRSSPRPSTCCARR